MTEVEKDRLCRQIVDGVGDAVIFCDRDGVIRLWNRAAEGIFGYSEKEAVGQLLNGIILERAQKSGKRGYGKAMLNSFTGYVAETVPAIAVTKAGERISIEVTSNRIRDSRGKVLGSVAVIRDVTAIRQREQLLRQKVAFLQAGQTAA
ncbi:MAG: PAS domain-containing protein [Verrucomicrobiota bacterium]